MTSGAKSGLESSNTLLVVIGVMKLIKAVLLVAVGIGAIRLLHRDVSETVHEWVREMRVDPDNRLIHSALEHLIDLTPEQLKELSLGTFLYAALYVVEGTGLLLRKRWAEYLTVVMTAAFLPLEVYELGRRVTAVRFAVFVLNIAIVVYLIARLRRERHAAR